MLNINIRYAKSYYIPGNQFDKGWGQLDSCLGIKYGRMGVTQKIGGYNLVFRIPEITFHWSFWSFPVFNSKFTQMVRKNGQYFDPFNKYIKYILHFILFFATLSFTWLHHKLLHTSRLWQVEQSSLQQKRQV